MPVRASNARSLLRRWNSLPEGSRRVLAAAALHANEIPDARLAEFAVNPADVDPLVADHWLTESKPGRWRLGVDADTIKGLIPWSVRRGAHVVLARVFQRQPQFGAQAAAHFESAGQPAEAGRIWLATARLHCQRHQYQAAGLCFADAVRLLPEDTPEPEMVAAVRDFGVCAAFLRDPGNAINLLGNWRGRAAWSGLPAFQAHAGRILADLFVRQGRHVEGAEARRIAAGNFLRAGLPADATGELLAAAGALAWALHFTRAGEAAAEAVARARDCGRADLESQALAAHGLTLGMLGETERGRALLEAALEIALTHRLTAQAADAYRLMGNVTDYASCYDDQTAFRKAIAYCGRHDHPTMADLCRGCLAYSLFRRGRWVEALRLARQVSAKSGAPEASRAAAITVHGLIRVLRGEIRPGVALIEKGRELGRRAGIGTIEIFAWTALAAAHETQLDAAAAAVCYRGLMDYWLGTEDQHDVLFGFCAAVTFFSLQGDREQAAAFASPLQRIAAATSNREALGAAHYAAAELKLLDHEPAAAAVAFREALAAFDAQNCAVESIRTRLRLASALFATGDVTAAVALRREARARAVRLGCRPLAALASRALPGAGAKEPAGPDGVLSPRQREVGRHLAAGRTNKEIAAALGLSVRTVDMHVAHLFARLDCRTRTEAAAKLGLR